MFIKPLKSYFVSHSISSGFTLIELLVVFSIFAILSTIGVAYFSSYTSSQKLRTATLDVKTVLLQARSQAQTQVKPNNCGIFQGYEVRICCKPSGSNCPIHSCDNNYQIYAVCSNNSDGIPPSSPGSTLPSGVSINDTGTTNRSYLFIPITGGVVKGGTIQIDGTNGQSQTITVSSTGVIQ